MGFCGGNSGDPIFTETFDTGTTNSSLPAGTTTYSFATGAPQDGSYTVSNNSNWNGWFDHQDHTIGDTDGKMLVVNASFTAGEFYRTTINGLCENTSYEFSSWLINILPASGCGGSGIPINVQFEIWDNTDTNLLASGDTGDINGTSTPTWEQYALVFQTLPAQTSVILKMINNGIGGCGNDLAIDDIVFRSCGDTVAIEDASSNTNVAVCPNQLPYSAQLTAVPDFTIFSTHFYQWQDSLDGINWTDIAGANNQNYTTPSLNTTTFYRVKIAEAIINLLNDSCNSASQVFEVSMIPTPAPPVIVEGDVRVCVNENEPLVVSVPNDVLVNWYDAPVGGNLLLSNSAFYVTGVSGVYYAEAESINGGCVSATRTAAEINHYELPQVQDETLEFCENTNITLHANSNIPTTTYLWNTGETTEQITVDTAGIYTVEVTNVVCTATKTIEVTQIDLPIIDAIESDGNDIVITTTNSGDFLYSLDGNIFQPSNTFINMDGGLYTIYVKESNCSEIVTAPYLHFYIPKYFTPNNDGENDSFDLKGIEFFSSSFVSIFNRYGKLLKSSRNSEFSWNGTFNNTLLPTDDYWYIVVIDGQKFTGHVTLKR